MPETPDTEQTWSWLKTSDLKVQTKCPYLCRPGTDS